MLRYLLSASTLTLLATGLAAQGAIVPAGLNTPGNGSQTSNWRGARRHQIVLDPRAVPTVGRQLQGIVLHGDENAAGGVPAQLDVTVMLSSVGVPLPGQVDPTSYASSLGSDATVVISNLRITAPTAANATLALPFAQPFAYQNGNPLLVRIEFVPVPTPAIDNPTWILDTHHLPDAFWSTTGTTVGAACPAPGQWTVTSDRVHDGLQFRWSTTAGSSNQLAFVLFGLSDQHFGALPLPLDLSLFGMPGCALRTSIDAALPTLTVAGGGFNWVLVDPQLPRQPRLAGMHLFAQAMVYDPAANSAGLQFSELRREQLVTPPDPILASHAYGPFTTLFPNDTPELVVRNDTLVFGLQ